MSRALKSQASTATRRISLTSLHNCPACRCKSTEPPAHLTDVRSQTFMQDRKHSNNLYLSQDLSLNCQQACLPQPGSERTVFANRIRLSTSPTQSPQKTSVTFSYSSPLKTSLSSEGKFKVKTFKKKHFPGLSQREEQLVKMVRKQQEKQSTYYQTYTEEESPKQPKILKLSQAKSRQKLEITVSRRSSSKNSIGKKSFSSKSISGKEDTLSNQPYEHSGLERPSPTPISALWKLENRQGTQNSLSYSQVVASRHPARPSIENIQLSRIQDRQSSPRSSSQRLSPFPESNFVSLARNPSAQSIQTHSDRPLPRQLFQSQHLLRPRMEENGEERGSTQVIFRNRSLQQSVEMGVGAGQREQFLMAQDLSEQLELHYDYYRPPRDSDRSLSLNYVL